MRLCLPRTRPEYLLTLRTFAFSGPGLCCDAFRRPTNKSIQSPYMRNLLDKSGVAQGQTARPPGVKRRNPSASASRPSGEWNEDDCDVLADGAVVGRILKVHAARWGRRVCGRWPSAILRTGHR